MTPLRRRFIVALILYAVLGIAAWFTLDGQFRWIVVILLVAMAFRTWVALRREELQ